MSWVDRSTSQSSASLQQGRKTSLRSLTRKFQSLVRFKNGAKIQTASSSGFDHFHQPTEEKESTPSNSSGRPLASLPTKSARVCVWVCACECGCVLVSLRVSVRACDSEWERERERGPLERGFLCAQATAIHWERKEVSFGSFFLLPASPKHWLREEERERVRVRKDDGREGVRGVGVSGNCCVEAFSPELRAWTDSVSILSYHRLPFPFFLPLSPSLSPSLLPPPVPAFPLTISPSLASDKLKQPTEMFHCNFFFTTRTQLVWNKKALLGAGVVENSKGITDPQFMEIHPRRVNVKILGPWWN